MQYQDARSLIKTGDMLLFRNHVGGGLLATGRAAEILA